MYLGLLQLVIYSLLLDFESTLLVRRLEQQFVRWRLGFAFDGQFAN